MKRGRPKTVSDDVLLQLHQGEGISRDALARAFKKHPSTIDKALRRARGGGKVKPTVSELHEALERLVCEVDACPDNTPEQLGVAVEAARALLERF